MPKSKDYFQAICKVGRAFGTTLETDELLDLIVHSAAETMEAKAASLYLRDMGKGELIPVAHTGLSEEYVEHGRTSVNKMEPILLTEGYINSRDSVNDERLDNHQAKKDEGIASILIVPMLVSKKLDGILAVFSAVEKVFTHDEIVFLTALAEQGVIAVQHTRLVERARKNTSLFLDLAANMNASLDLKTILHILTADISEAFDLKGVNIRLLNKDAGTLDLMASYGLSEEFLGKGQVLLDKSVVRAFEGETVVIKDARTDERIQYRDAMKAEGIVSMLCVPVKSAEEVIGVMRLCAGEEREFSEPLIMTVSALAYQGGLAIQKAVMFNLLKEDKKCLEKEIWSHRNWF